MGKKIKIKDTRKVDMVTGKPLSPGMRFDAEVDSDYLEYVIDKAKKYGNDPLTAIAMNLAETRFDLNEMHNPFHLGNYNPQGDVIDESMKFMADKFKTAKRLGKIKDEDIIQVWNGLAQLKDKGTLYGIDTNKTPIDTKLNPVYGKRVVNLRDSVIKTNPEIVKLVNKYKDGGKLNNTPMKRTDKNRYRVVDLYDGQIYDTGGWLDDAIIGAGSGALSGASLGPIGAIAGGVLGAITGGIGGSKEAEAKEEERKRQKLLNQTIMPRTVGLDNTTGSVMPFKKGGKIKKVMHEFKEGTLHSGSKKGPKVKSRKQAIAIALSEARKAGQYENGGDMMNQDLIEIQGPSHEEGGVQFTHNAELEGGETVYNDIVNSDSWIITKEIAEQYGLPKQAIGKKPSEYSKIVNNKYKDRNVDPFAMKSKEMELNNIAQMSMEIGEMIKQNNNQYQDGGPVRTSLGRPNYWKKGTFKNALKETNEWSPFPNTIEPQFETYINEFGQPMKRLVQSSGNMISSNNTKSPYDPMREYSILTNPYGKDLGLNKSNSLPPVRQIDNNVKNPGKTKQLPITIKVNNNNPVPWQGNYQNQGFVQTIINKGLQKPTLSKPLSGLQKSNTSNSMTWDNVSYGNLNIPGNDNVSTPDMRPKGEGLNKLMGAAPIIMGGVNALRSILQGSEKPVHFARTHYDPVNPEFIDPSYQLRQNEDAFATGNEQMQQQSKKDWLRRRIQSATEEGKNASGILGQVQTANTQMLNQAKQINQQNRMQTNQLNLETSMREEDVNAANRGAWETNRDYQLNNLATMAGEFARDKRMEEADKEYRDKWLNQVGDMFGGQTLDPNQKWINIGEGLAVPQNGYVYQQNKTNLPSMQQKSPVQYEDLNIQGNDYLFKNRDLFRKSRLGNIGINKYRND